MTVASRMLFARQLAPSDIALFKQPHLPPPLLRHTTSPVLTALWRKLRSRQATEAASLATWSSKVQPTGTRRRHPTSSPRASHRPHQQAAIHAGRGCNIDKDICACSFASHRRREKLPLCVDALIILLLRERQTADYRRVPC